MTRKARPLLNQHPRGLFRQSILGKGHPLETVIVIGDNFIDCRGKEGLTPLHLVTSEWPTAVSSLARWILKNRYSNIQTLRLLAV
jgi:hypothetical protein